MLRDPFGWLGLICVAVGIKTILRGLPSAQASHAFSGSGVFIAGLMIAAAAGVFPLMLLSTLEPRYSLSAYHTAAAGHGLAIALAWWPVAFICAVVYFLFIYRHYHGKVKLSEDSQIPY
jgi:cytochrome bd ubiquinol oxidase subunit II